MSPRLIQICPKCGYTNSAVDTKCAECGARLPGPASEVADRASGPPPSSNNPAPTRKPQPGWIAWVVGLVALGFFLAVAQTAQLDCQRDRPGGPVNCTKETRFLGVVPVGQERIEDVRLAQVEEASDEDGTSYRVTLNARGGPVPLTNAFTPSYSRKYEMVRAINAFIHSPGSMRITVTDPGMFTPETFGCLVIWIIGSAAWNLLKRLFQARKAEQLPG